MPARLLILAAALLTLLGLPLAFRLDQPHLAAGPDAARLVVITPHNEQIRAEFGSAFSDWHQRRFGVRAAVDWRAPGGTSEIRRLLDAQYARAVKTGRISPDGAAPPGTMPYDILFGGGAFEHDVVKRGVTVELPGPAGEPTRVAVPISVPVPFSDHQLHDWFGENAIGPGILYDKDRHWLGSALTAFGIGYNRDVLARLGLPHPTTWNDLADHRYRGWLAMTDPRHSGSVATTYDAILNNLGWDEGWRVLRGMSANARFFANTSLKPPLEISAGEAAAGPVLEFYGRYQSQALLRPGQRAEESRLGYVDPPGMVFIDADPISILRGGPNPETAARFVEFVLSEEGQALWQFPARGDDAPAPTDDPATWGPARDELRRMPVRRVMYERHRDRFVDHDLRPFEIVSPAPLRGWRPLIDELMSAFAIDILSEVRAARDAMARAREAGASPGLLAELDELFYAMPPHPFPDGSTEVFSESSFKRIRDDWRDPRREPLLRIAYTRFFRENYREIVRRVREAGY